MRVHVCMCVCVRTETACTFSGEHMLSLDANAALRTAALTDTTSPNHRKDFSDVTSDTSCSEIRRTKREKSLLGGFTAEHFRTAAGDGHYEDKVFSQGSLITKRWRIIVYDFFFVLLCTDLL